MDTHQFSFEKLIAWQEAKEVYQCTQTFPGEEKFGMVSQMRRAATSVCANIVEGSTRSSAKDQAHFTTLAFGSLIELLNHLLISVELGFINGDQLNKFRDIVQPLSIKLTNLKKYQLSRLNKFQTVILFVFSYSIYTPFKPLNF